MQNGRLYPLVPVSRDRMVSKFPKCSLMIEQRALQKAEKGKMYPNVLFISMSPSCYTPQACLQMKDHWHSHVKSACQDRAVRSAEMAMSKVVVVGDLHVGKTCLINRFCKDMFDRDYKATIGVDFEIEKFEVAGVPFSLQIWDTAGQEKFKCIASAYYRGAQVIITVFDMADIKTLEHTRQWLEEAMKENEPGMCFVFLVGTKRDLLSPAECQRTEKDAVRMAADMHAEFWSVSAKTGENVQDLFFRVTALAFEDSVLQDLERAGTPSGIGAEGLIRIDGTSAEGSQSGAKRTLSCC